MAVVSRKYAWLGDDRTPPGFPVIWDTPARKGHPTLIDEDDSLTRPCNLHSIFDYGPARPTVHRVNNGVCAHLTPQPRGTFVEFCVLAVWVQCAGLDGTYLVGFSCLVGVARPVDPAVLVAGYGGLAGCAGIAVDDFVVVVVSIYYPGQSQLSEVVETDSSFALLSGPVQCRYQYRHQYRNDGNHHQKFYQSKSSSFIHKYTSTFTANASISYLGEMLGVGVLLC